MQRGARRGQLLEGAPRRSAQWPECSIIRSMPELIPTGVAVLITKQAVPEGHKARMREMPMSKWRVLHLDRLPAYITWDHYLANQERLLQNRYRPGSGRWHLAPANAADRHLWFAVPVAGG